MDRPENDAPQDGAKFLEQLDAALDGKPHAGEHADLAAFGAELKNVLNSNEDEMNTTAPEKLSRSLNLKTRKEKSSVVKLDKKLSRFRLGLLDIAALFGVAVLGFLIWNALKTPAPTAKKDPEPVPVKKENTFAAEDGKEKSKDPDADPAPTPPPSILPAFERTELAKKLQSTVSFEFVDTPLDEGLEFMRRISKTTIIVDPKAIAGEMPPLTLKVQNMSFVSALRWMARLSGLRMSISQQHTIVFSKPENEELLLETYDTNGLKLRAESLATIIQRMPFEPSFLPDSKASVTGKDGKLTVISSMQAQEQIQLLLKQVQSEAKSGMIDFRPRPNWHAALEKKLDKKISFEFVDTKFEEAVAFIQTLTAIPVVIDPKVLAEGPPTITLRVQEMSAKLALGWMARLCDLNIAEHDEALYVFKGDTPTHFVAYKPDQATVDMAGEIRNRIHPKSWDPAAGTSIEEMDGWVIIRQSSEVHSNIQTWLSGKVKNPEQ